jgi:hypothetical protein
MQHIRRLTFQQMGVLWGQVEDATPPTHSKKKEEKYQRKIKGPSQPSRLVADFRSISLISSY